MGVPELKFDASLVFDESNPTKEEIEDFILSFESFSMNFPQVELPVNHFFSKGVYGREMRVPKGTMLTGKFHKYQNLNILSSGKITVLSANGKQEVEAPFTQVFEPGKKMFYAHTDFVWTTIVGTEKTDHDEIEKEFINLEIGLQKTLKQGE